MSIRFFIALSLILLAGCADRRESTQKEDPLPRLKVEIIDPPGPLAPEHMGLHVNASIQSAEAGEKAYFLDLDFSDSQPAEIIRWGVLVRVGNSSVFGIPTDGMRSPHFYTMPPILLIGGNILIVELRYIEDLHAAGLQSCPHNPYKCPLAKTIRVDATAFKE